MYDKSDPRSTLSLPSVVADGFAGAEYAKFYEIPPMEKSGEASIWYARGQNFIVAYAEASVGAEFIRRDQPDEYVVLLSDFAGEVQITAGSDAIDVAGTSIAFVPPGESIVRVTKGGRFVMLFTTRSQDLCDKCINAGSYVTEHPNIPPFAPWPSPHNGFKLRQYSLEVPEEPGRFGRIWRCSTFMVNFLPEQVGPRDTRKLSPHHHDSFEQGSLALQGSFTHHIRWPWTQNLNEWRQDEHEHCLSPSLAVIPPLAIHTSRGMDAGVNQLVDIFCPPRLDFSSKPGWVLNASDYPMPGASDGEITEN